MLMDQLIPKPDEIRRRLEAIDHERRSLRRLLSLSQLYHGDQPGAPVGIIHNTPSGEPMKLETKS